MKLKTIHEKRIIEEFLKDKNPNDYHYYYNNLESPFWENTQWFGLFNKEKLEALAMYIIKYGFPVLLCTSYSNDEYAEELAKQLKAFLPKDLYAHLNRRDNNFQGQVCKYYNMELKEHIDYKGYNAKEVVRLTKDDYDIIVNLLEKSHPEYLLEREFVEENYFFGIKDGHKLICVGGISAKNEEVAVAAIGCVTTHPDYRKKGLGTKVMVEIIKNLLGEYENICLNVKEENLPAIGCYEKLGFKKIGFFNEVITG
ncbi:GNAT family N-acetyltransferase [Anaeromicrobium sediminis]|nr:GNAT family N-acetyltransferase [Anaeromicrobium sediminis]